MKASIVDLRYRMKGVLRALDRNEEVTVLHRGTVKGTIVPAGSGRHIRVKDHPLFSSATRSRKTVEQQMDELRGGRFRDL